MGDPAGPGPAPAYARACQAGHLQYSGVEKWMWASSKLRGARVAQTALTQDATLTLILTLILTPTLTLPVPLTLTLSPNPNPRLVALRLGAAQRGRRVR